MYLELLNHSEILGSHSDDYEDYCLLGCDALYSGKWLPMLYRHNMPQKWS
jgi:hypothetical protein